MIDDNNEQNYHRNKAINQNHDSNDGPNFDFVNIK